MPDTPDTSAVSSASVLGFDFGTRVIGVAVGNRLTGARALTTVSNGDAPDWQRLDALIGEWRPAMLIVGLPLMLDGSEQAMSRAARAFGAALAERYGIEVARVAERRTTHEAARRGAARRPAARAKRKHAAEIDAIAAEVILENWLATAAA